MSAAETVTFHAPTAGPILKWAGGKGRLLPQLLPLLPVGVDRMRHVEPFFGGGAMFFARRPERAVIADINPDLIAMYMCIRDDVEAVIDELRLQMAVPYYTARSLYNQRSAPPYIQAARFIYLNRTCFNGLYRVNARGDFNVPVGRYKNPRILDVDGLRAASRALASAELRCQGFATMLAYVRRGDFVYLDPPYVPVSATSSFTGYASGGFGDGDQRTLRDVFVELDRHGAKLMLSNSDTPFVRELYAGFGVTEVTASRSIGSKGSSRGAVTEVVVRNYRRGP